MSEVSASMEVSKNAREEKKLEKGSKDHSETQGDDSEDGKLANEDVQRAIDGLADIPDDKLQEFFNDEDFMEGLDVVDAWEGDADNSSKSSRGMRNKERDRRRSSRERSRRDRKSPYGRDRPRREDRKREDIRRDPSKSSKDIERDKLRTRKDTASKILAEKEKAIKHLLDSDNVVPPGTEVEALQEITDKQQNTERTQTRSRKSRERRGISPLRRRSNDRIRLSPNRRISDERRQIRISSERRRTMASPPLRRSWERRASRERSLERHRRREERELRLAARRSRSRERQRSRSVERYRKRWSRSPNGRRSSMRRHSRSRTPERRTRKRSPFINEIARQFGAEGLMPRGPTSEFLPGIPPLMGPGFPQDQVTPVPPPPPSMQQFMHHPGPPGPSGIHMQGTAPPFVNFDLGPPMNFEAGRGPLLHTPQPDYVAAPIMYNQGNPSRTIQQPIIGPPVLNMPMHSPQPVPAPGPPEHAPMTFNQSRCPPNLPVDTLQQKPEISSRRTKSPKPSRNSYEDLKKTLSSFTDAEATRPQRLLTPEPPIISNSKLFEKTSLSSLLEASVSAKDTHGPPVLYPGFKPEILRQCELALRDLPKEDLRFKTKGRFFYDPKKEEQELEPENSGSNSVLLRTGRSRINWGKDDNVQNTIETPKQVVETHQKICQTDEIETQCKAVQATILPKKSDFCHQVYPNEILQANKEKKTPIMERLDWNVHETYEFGPKIRETGDLRWSLSNSSQKRNNSWNRGLSPSLAMEEEGRLSASPMINVDHSSRSINVASTTRGRENFSYDRSSSRELYSRERFSPTYRRSMERPDDFRDARSNHSRGESPMALEESPDEVEILDNEHYQRSSDWRSRGSTSFGPSSALHKLRAMRGKSSGRGYHGRGGFRGKF